MATTSGAMSLMDKYASINSNIEDARRRVASTRANVDAMNLKIQHLRENRAEMIDQTNDANAEASKLKAELEKYAEEQRAKIAEKNRVERENNIAKCGYNDTKNLIDKERREFLERCREFRTSCRKNRAAASILVLDRGGNFEARDAIDEIDLWRKLQEEDLSDGGEDKKNDSELDEAEKKEKESRQYYIEAECRLHTTRSEHESATTRCSARRVKLTQQRAQLERHRNELEELSVAISRSKDEVVEANELAKTFEKGESRMCCHTLYAVIFFFFNSSLHRTFCLSQNAKGGSKFTAIICRLLTATISIMLHRNLPCPIIIHTVATLKPRITCLSPTLTIERLLQTRLPIPRRTIRIVHEMEMEEYLHLIDMRLI